MVFVFSATFAPKTEEVRHCVCVCVRVFACIWNRLHVHMGVGQKDLTQSWLSINPMFPMGQWRLHLAERAIIVFQPGYRQVLPCDQR